MSAMTYNQSIRFLYDLQVFGMKFGLKGIRTLLGSIGNPHRDFPCIHVAGTNGKGSTSSMLAAISTAAGYKTGLYTSPHLVSFTERIRIDGKPVSRSAVSRLTSLIKRQVVRQQSTFFEAVTAIAFKHFSDEGVDIAIVETGLGGRLDATNVVHPRVSVITNVGLEHTEILGNTIEEIAWEKAGIIKRGVPCVTGIRQRTALGVVRRRASTLGATVTTTRGVSIGMEKSSLRGFTATFSTTKTRYRKVAVSLAGRHQALNLAVVVRVLEALRVQGEFVIRERDVRAGLRDVQKNAGLSARMSCIHRKPTILVDVAHNPDGIRTLVDSLKDLGVRNVLLVFGVVQDKDYEAMIELLKPVVHSAVLTTARTERARSITDLALEFSRQGIDVAKTEPVVADAVDAALALYGDRRPLLITGSHYVVGEALSHLHSRKFT
jgi:dihydrofolate synthase/folylpolyglutamate synthase